MLFVISGHNSNLLWVRVHMFQLNALQLIPVSSRFCSMWFTNALDKFNVHGFVHRTNIPIYIQQDAALQSSLHLETALHVSRGTSTHHRECMQICHTVNNVTNTTCCRYSCIHSWWWVEVPPETCRAVSRYNKLCNVASCWIQIGTVLDMVSFGMQKGVTHKKCIVRCL